MTARILVIEDNRDNMELVDILLRARGYTPLRATGGAEGVRLAIERRPDLILMDIQMPGMDGYEAAAAIRSHPDLGRARIVAITAFAMSGDRELAIAGGFDGYITKPLNTETFAAEIEQFLPPDMRSGPDKAEDSR